MITSKLRFSYQFKGHSQKINSVCFSDNNILASAARDKTIKIWQLKSGKLTNTQLFESLGANSLAFSSDSEVLLSGEDDCTVKFWSLQTQKLIQTLVGHEKTVNAIAVHPNGKLIASGSNDRTVKLWSFKSGKLVCAFTGHKDKVTAVLFSPDGNVLASSGDINDKTIKLWFLAENRNITLIGHSDWFGGVDTIAFTPDSQFIASGSKDKTIKIWQVKTGEEVITLNAHNDYITSIAISKDNNLLASASKDKTLKIWRLTTRELITTINCQEYIQTVTFSPDSQILVIGSSQGNISLLKPQSTSNDYLKDLLI